MRRSMLRNILRKSTCAFPIIFGIAASFLLKRAAMQTHSMLLPWRWPKLKKSGTMMKQIPLQASLKVQVQTNPVQARLAYLAPAKKVLVQARLAHLVPTEKKQNRVVPYAKTPLQPRFTNNRTFSQINPLYAKTEKPRLQHEPTR